VALYLTNQNFGTPADTQPRLSLQGSAAPAILLGAGGASTADIQIVRSAAGIVKVTSNAAATSTVFTVEGTSGQNSLLRLAITGDAFGSGRIQLSTQVGGLSIGDGSATWDTYLRRSAAKTLIFDTDGSGGALTTVDFKTTNLWQNGSPITAVATQVQRASGAASDYVAEIKLTADTQYRAILGLDGSSNPQLLMGIGGTTAPDVLLTRTAAGLMKFSSNGNAVTSHLLVEATSAQLAYLSVAVAGDTAGTRTALRGDATVTGLTLGSGAATDARFVRTAAGATKIDANAVAATNTLLTVEALAGQTATLDVDVAGDTAHTRMSIRGDATATSVVMGSGTTADIQISRQAGGSLRLSGNGAAVNTVVAVEATSGQTSSLNVQIAGDAVGGRASLRGDATLTGLTFGGSASADIYLRRSAVKTLVLDTDGASGALTLVNVISTGFQWNGLPVSQAVGQVVTLNFVIDGGGVAITTGIKGDLVIDFACTIQQVTLLADQSGSIVVDIWKQVYASFPPLVAQTITASALPTITTATKAQDATLTGWTKTINAGDILRLNVNSATTVQRVTLSLKVTRT
jgi:hypothetical protein